ncbi:alpha/beta fold hydrolase [Oscillatoria sp. FACHB-1406]|uniref:alpha/beta fold hydrolase n=1 Tax=Oscillatoria sp. FACHB-1406 TaxID=2692846 RepID=UPI0016864F55|nr:alpha/beta fold hydrolase [Oscillatoria sp. FACHB-1406]
MIQATSPSLQNRSTWNWQNHQIQYAVQGTGSPLLLIHGFGASIGHWRKNLPVLAAAGYRVFALDLLGFGNSDKPLLNYTLDLWQQQIYDFWQEKIQAPTVFIGNSIGGLLALMVTANFPEIAAGCTVINCAGGLNHRPEELPAPLRAVMGTFTKVVSSPLSGPVLFNLIRRKPQLRRTLSQVYRDRAAITEELVEMLYQPSCHPNAQKVFASILTAPPGPTPASLLQRLERPLLVIWGEDDPWTPLAGAKVYRELAERNPDVTFTSIPKAGHCPHDECPDLVNASLLDWLNSDRFSVISP